MGATMTKTNKITGRIGLRLRFGLAISALIAAVAAFFAIYFPSRLESAAGQALRARAIGLTTTAANLVAPALDYDQAVDAEQHLKTISADADLRYAVVLGADGRVFARHRAAGVPESAELRATATEAYSTVSGGMLHVSLPLRHGGRAIGTLVAGYSRDA